MHRHVFVNWCRKMKMHRTEDVESATSPSPTVKSVDLGEPSLSDMINCIRAADDLPSGTRILWTSSTERLPVLLGKSLDQLPARLSAIRWGLKQICAPGEPPERRGTQEEAYHVTEALAWFQERGLGVVTGAPLSNDWKTAMKYVSDRRRRLLLGAFARYCSARQIGPRHVSQDTFREYFELKKRTSFSRSGPPLPRVVIKVWNSVGKDNSTWPGAAVADIPKGSRVKVSWDSFPNTLRAAIDTYLLSLSQAHRIANDRRWSACRPSAIETRRRELQAFARKAVAAGIRIDRLRSLRALLSPEVVVPTFEAYLSQNSDRPWRYASDLSRKLHSLARVIEAPAKTIAVLGLIKSQLARNRGSELSSKGLDIIREVFSGDTWPRVVALPRSLFAEAQRLNRKSPKKARALAAAALQIQILTRAPIRCCDLLSIRMDLNLLRRKGQKNYLLTFPDYDRKNRVDFEFPLSTETSDMIRKYLRMFHQDPQGATWLFQSVRGQKLGSDHASAVIGKLLEERIGIRIRAHQFRHAAAALILKSEPGNYQYVQRVLGHLNLQTTINLYSQLEGFQSSDQFSELLKRSSTPVFELHT